MLNDANDRPFAINIRLSRVVTFSPIYLMQKVNLKVPSPSVKGCVFYFVLAIDKSVISNQCFRLGVCLCLRACLFFFFFLFLHSPRTLYGFLYIMASFESVRAFDFFESQCLFT